MNSLGELPIVLRQEAFGGVLFDPADATFLELDPEGFALLCGYADRSDLPLHGEAAALMAEVRRNVADLDRRPIRRVAPVQADSDAPLPVLSAPSLVDFQITNQCYLNCPHCYADSVPSGAHAPLDDVKMALDQVAELGCFQVAIGGGEPLLHPQLGEILAHCHALGMVPNLTTSGLHLDDEKIALIRRYCGAVGVSLEGVGDAFGTYRKSGFRRFLTTLERFRENDIPVVLQVTLNTEVYAQLDEVVAFCGAQPDLYGVIFLAFKPVGRGAGYGTPLSVLPAGEVHQRLQDCFMTLSKTTRVGFDCCLTAGVIGPGSDFDAHAARYLEGCSALRSSIGISSTLDVMPCTFTPGHAVGNLHEQSLREIWSGLNTRRFRQQMADRAGSNAQCSSCQKYSFCLGGCPVMELVNCSNDYLASSVPLTDLLPRG